MSNAAESRAFGWRARFETIKTELAFYRALLADAETPRLAKWLLGLAIAYLLSPIDLIPDFLPVVGQLDDLVIVPVLVWCALALVPRSHRDAVRIRFNADRARRAQPQPAVELPIPLGSETVRR